MKLHVEEAGRGDRTAILVHGITADAGSWVRVAPALVGRGYRVLMPELRGHGRSARGDYSPAAWADDLADSVPAGADLALGHSLGGIALQLAVDRLEPRLAVFEDPAWLLTGDRAATAASYRSHKTWDEAQVRRAYPRWSDADVAAKLASTARWDPETTHALASFEEFTPRTPPRRPSLVMLADPSELVPPDRAERLRDLGYDVLTVAGAGHSIHRDDLDAFLGALLDWVAQRQ